MVSKIIVRIAVPAAVGQSITAIGFAVMNSIIVSYGEQTLAAFSVGNRISSLVLHPVMAIGGIRQEPVVKDGEIKVGNRMKVTMSCDHRVVDGVSGAQFLNTFKNYIENPIVLLGMSEI